MLEAGAVTVGEGCMEWLVEYSLWRWEYCVARYMSCWLTRSAGRCSFESIIRKRDFVRQAGKVRCVSDYCLLVTREKE